MPASVDAAHAGPPAADKGAEKPYRLLADAMAKSGRVAIAELVSRGKEQLVLIRPYRKGLVLHTMYHADEVRDFQQVPKGEKVNVSKQELELGIGLIDRLTSQSSTRRIIKTSIGSACWRCSMKRAKAKR